MKFGIFLLSILIIAAIGSSTVFLSRSNFVYRTIASEQEIVIKNGRELWEELVESAVTFNASASNLGTLTSVTFGAEKEASSSLITRVMGPSCRRFSYFVERLVEMEDGKKDAKTFLVKFLDGIVNGRLGREKDEQGKWVKLAQTVRDNTGALKEVDLSDFEGRIFADMDYEELQEFFRRWLDQTGDKPFSYLNRVERAKIFKGEFVALSPSGQRLATRYFEREYGDYEPLFGKAQDYIERAQRHHGGEHGGWEINFKPQENLAKFEQMIAWFQKSLERNGQLFEAPGHNWMVFKTPEKNLSQFKEMLKAIQALIGVDGLGGQTGIEWSSFKEVHSDADIMGLYDVSRHEWNEFGGIGTGSRGVIRLELDRFERNSVGVELRAGTKDAATRRFVEMVMTSRVQSGDYSGLARANKWLLVEKSSGRMMRNLSRRYGVSPKVSTSFEQIAVKYNLSWDSTLKLAPLWHWERAPFASTEKKALLKRLAAKYIDDVVELGEKLSDQDFRREYSKILAQWANASNLRRDLRTYLAPKHFIENLEQVHLFKPSSSVLERVTRRGDLIDVNKIDLGIEYSGRFPIKYNAEFASTRSVTDARLIWQRTNIDLRSDEREHILAQIARNLREELGGGSEVEKVVEESSSHGHDLDLAYGFSDQRGRFWRVEWDGIGRSYNADGSVISGSLRGGSIELVTPKFQPTVSELKAVFQVFSDNSIIPSRLAGGGHINFDLAPFMDRPKSLARFLSIFHQYQGIISYMFQHPSRLFSAEPLELSSNLVTQLADFNGTTEDLQKLLYNEGYFNKRLGRKTRYSQINALAYFQDVIPEEFISEDFDIRNPQVAWRRTFRVDPEIRKIEMRLFDAPRDAYESALQMKLVRAMMDKALNDDGPLIGRIQAVDHLAYANDFAKAEDALRKMGQDLGFSIDEYRVYISEASLEMKRYMSSEFYRSFGEKVRNFPRMGGWKQAVSSRSASEVLASQGRIWDETLIDPQAEVHRQGRIEDAKQAALMREDFVRMHRSAIDVSSMNCAQLMSEILTHIY